MDYFNTVIKYDPVNHYILFSQEDLKSIKKNISKEELEELKLKLASINEDFSLSKRSVIFKQVKVPGVGLKDYASLATYYWPDPNKQDGLPYILRDGESNPEGDLFDKNNLRLLAFNVYYQTLLYYLTNDKSYYDMMKKNLNYYFFDSVTGMNPNLSHAQMRKGTDLGRGIGMIDFTANFSYSLWMMKQLRNFGLLEEELDCKMVSWLEEFYDWFMYHPIALQERYANNNHGTFFDFGLLMICDYLGKEKEILPIVYNILEYRMPNQFANDGSLPQELARTKSKSYSLMGYKGFTDSAIITKQYGYDLWDVSWYFKKINNNLYNGLDFLNKALVKKEIEWTSPQITIYDESTVVPLIHTGISMNKMTKEDYNSLNVENIFDDLIYILAKKAVD